jgi:hypothetical protein
MQVQGPPEGGKLDAGDGLLQELPAPANGAAALEEAAVIPSPDAGQHTWTPNGEATFSTHESLAQAEMAPEKRASPAEVTFKELFKTAEAATAEATVAGAPSTPALEASDWPAAGEEEQLVRHPDQLRKSALVSKWDLTAQAENTSEVLPSTAEVATAAPAAAEAPALEVADCPAGGTGEQIVRYPVKTQSKALSPELGLTAHAKEIPKERPETAEVASAEVAVASAEVAEVKLPTTTALNTAEQPAGSVEEQLDSVEERLVQHPGQAQTKALFPLQDITTQAKSTATDTPKTADVATPEADAAEAPSTKALKASDLWLADIIKEPPSQTLDEEQAVRDSVEHLDCTERCPTSNADETLDCSNGAPHVFQTHPADMDLEKWIPKPINWSPPGPHQLTPVTSNGDSEAASIEVEQMSEPGVGGWAINLPKAVARQSPPEAAPTPPNSVTSPTGLPRVSVASPFAKVGRNSSKSDLELAADLSSDPAVAGSRGVEPSGGVAETQIEKSGSFPENGPENQGSTQPLDKGLQAEGALPRDESPTNPYGMNLKTEEVALKDSVDVTTGPGVKEVATPKSPTPESIPVVPIAPEISKMSGGTNPLGGHVETGPAWEGSKSATAIGPQTAVGDPEHPKDLPGVKLAKTGADSEHWGHRHLKAGGHTLQPRKKARLPLDPPTSKPGLLNFASRAAAAEQLTRLPLADIWTPASLEIAIVGCRQTQLREPLHGGGPLGLEQPFGLAADLCMASSTVMNEQLGGVQPKEGVASVTLPIVPPGFQPPIRIDPGTGGREEESTRVVSTKKQPIASLSAPSKVEDPSGGATSDGADFLALLGLVDSTENPHKKYPPPPSPLLQ